MKDTVKNPPAQHASFTIERRFTQAPARVFAAWADPEAKVKWFAGTAGKWKPLVREMDFRVGGRERGTAAQMEKLEKALRDG